MIRVVLVDDQALIRMGLKVMLESQPDIAVVGEAADGQEGVNLISELNPDVVLMDIRMPGTDGLEATARVTSNPDSPKVIVLTTFGDETYVRKALTAGAIGFLLKDTQPTELIAAVRKASEGVAVLDPSVTSLLIRQFTQDSSPRRSEAAHRLDVLTSRERDVVVSLGYGQSNAEIARRLGLSEATIKGHVSKAMDKLQCSNRTQMAIMAYEAGLVTPI